MRSPQRQLPIAPRPWLEKKLIEPQDLEEKCRSIRLAGRTIATVNGCFDLLHAGHLFFIYEASKLADDLIIALNSDESIRNYKSPFRPLISLSERLEVVAALEFVHYVTWFEEEDPRYLLEQIKPHVHVNGVEYAKNCIEESVVYQYGGRVHFVERLRGLSTSSLIEKAKRCP